MRNSPTVILEVNTEPRNALDSTIAVSRFFSITFAFGSTVSFVKISAVSTPTEPGLQEKKKRKKKVRHENT